MDENVILTAAQGSRDLSRPPTSRIIGNIPDYNSRLRYRSMTLEKRLEMWIEAHCIEKNPRPRRVAELNAIFREIYDDRRFWRYRNKENRDYYEDAIALMWQFFCRNLCEVKTARGKSPIVLPAFWWKWYMKIQNDRSTKPERIELWFISLVVHHLSIIPRSFLDTRDYAVERLLVNLKGNLQNIKIRLLRKPPFEVPPIVNPDAVFKDPLDKLPNPEPNLARLQFEEFLILLEADPTGELKDEDNTLHGIKKSTKETTREPYTLTAQTYLLMRYRDDKPIQQIADELDIPYGTLQGQGSGTPARWKALERNYAEMAINNII